ncbi:MAG: glycolate oxidase subunit GlcE [Comamonadaceae bacterium]|nr:glycolate oxidase subunit GlcE [Comamonadaceae bacterium]
MTAYIDDLQERVRAASAHRTALRITGGGTKDFHPHGAPQSAGEPLALRPLAGVVSYEPTELVVTARAGTPLAELQALLAAQDQCLAFEPPLFAPGGTVGGMVASGLSGPARASVGALRDFVLGVEIVNGKGELLRFGGQVMKNVAGYDVSRLMAGSWGQLGVITEVSLKVLPRPVAEATLRFACTQEEALARLNAWGGRPLPLNASCWVQADGQALLYLRLRGARAAVDAAVRTLGGERVNDAAGDWDACRDQRLPWFCARAPEHALWRLSVPQTAPVLALPEGVDAPLVEWHGGLRWVQAPLATGDALRVAARAVGGHATLFRAPDAGGTSAGADFYPENPALRAIHERLKQAFDPAGIFNTGRA